MRASGPLMPGTTSPNTNLSWDTRMWTAAAVVKPDTRVSDRYMTTKPTCRTPIVSWRRNERSRWGRDRVWNPPWPPTTDREVRGQDTVTTHLDDCDPDALRLQGGVYPKAMPLNSVMFVCHANVLFNILLTLDCRWKHQSFFWLASGHANTLFPSI